jgi:SAM-dependent methyltransferase
MDRYDEDTYGERVADVYDTIYPDLDDGCVEFLTERAKGGRALELGVGTGRVAIPLSTNGIEVHGIDASKAMLARLDEKPGAERITTHHGSFEAFNLGMTFNLIYVVFNTFYALLSQQAQISCFQHVARHLDKAGVFVLELFVPSPGRIASDPFVRVTDMTDQSVRLDLSIHDPFTQQISSQLITLSQDGVRLYPVKLRYVWPSELDLMARVAGMQLRERFGSWNRDEFNAESGKHISVYQLGDEATIKER